MKNIPDKIYLQIGDDTPNNVDFNDLDEVTWCSEKISENDIEFFSVEKAVEAFNKTGEKCRNCGNACSSECEKECIINNFKEFLNK